ncbi:MAG: hypothetical protein FD166_1669 [Bacteroidetes bacterium]|nr:MAG: hypothetical protein FD166_1669 [Bacteroidota bacterium]
MNSHFWSGICRAERIKSISGITGIADRYATILNFQKFSDISLSLMMETEECRLAGLLTDLKTILLIEGADAIPSDSMKTCLVFLNISFTEGTGHLEFPVPEIPG